MKRPQHGKWKKRRERCERNQLRERMRTGFRAKFDPRFTPRFDMGFDPIKDFQLRMARSAPAGSIPVIWSPHVPKDYLRIVLGTLICGSDWTKERLVEHLDKFGVKQEAEQA